MRSGDTAGLEGLLNGWLASEAGVELPRRVVAAGAERIVVSKLGPGFADELRRLLVQVAELFDVERVREAYAREAARRGAGAPRVAVWRAGAHALLAELGRERGIAGARQAEVRAGIDAVAAVLDTVLWSSPAVADDYAPRPGELDAYRAAASRLAGGRDAFTRYYGSFDGRAVVAHCAGAAEGRALLAQAWRICTATAPPD